MLKKVVPATRGFRSLLLPRSTFSVKATEHSAQDKVYILVKKLSGSGELTQKDKPPAVKIKIVEGETNLRNILMEEMIRNDDDTNVGDSYHTLSTDKLIERVIYTGIENDVKRNDWGYSGCAEVEDPVKGAWGIEGVIKRSWGIGLIKTKVHKNL
jgi:hypothetical protein